MAKHAWTGYAKFAMGENELKPRSQHGEPGPGNIFPPGMGATMVDAASTLSVMGLTAELAQAEEWIFTKLNFARAASVSVFETNIRFLGGLLSGYALTGAAR
jgi:mannosyl-oligosaccharide alpha-1,2-mannosidase